MTALLRSELLKQRSTRLSWGLPLVMFASGLVLSAVMAAVVAFGALTFGVSELPLQEVLPDLGVARLVYTSGISFGYLLTLVLGVLAMGQEFRHRTATGTFLASPRRGRVVAAKAAVLVPVAAVNGAAHLAGAIVGGGVVLALNDLAVFPEPGQLMRTLALGLLVMVLWALIGLGLGALITNQVAALFLAVALAWIIEPLLGWGLTFLDGGDAVARFFPSQATTATLSLYEGMDPQLAQMMGAAGEQLPWWGGGLVLAGYAALLAGIGAWLTSRRDIT